VRVLLLLSHRTGYRQPFGDRSYHQRIALRPLSGTEMSTMASSVLGTTEMPETVRTLIAQKAEGNPFFVEELTKSLLEDGALCTTDGRIELARDLDAVTVPDTIHDVLIARIDRLAEESRRAIQVASVIGREFALRLLARITEAGERVHSHVDELRSLELIYEKALHPELAYMFKHALTHDVAYDSVVRGRRTALHRTIGLAIEDLYADRLTEHYETLAHHFSRGEEWERALRYHQLSADKAAETYANRAVVEHCRQALSIAERIGTAIPDETLRQLHERMAAACFYLSEFAAAGAAHEEAAARSAGPEAQAMHLSNAGFSYVWGHRYEPSRRCIETALALSRERALPRAEAAALVVWAFYRAVHDAEIGDYERYALQALEICKLHPHEGVEGLAHFTLAQVSEWSGDYAQAIDRGQAALALGRKLRRPDLIIFSVWFLAKARCCIGDYGPAVALLQEAYELSDRIGDRAWKSRLLNTLGWCIAEIGGAERARTYNVRAAELAREIGDPEILANADINLAMNYLTLGNTERALEHLQPIEQALARPGDPWMRWRYALHALDARGQIELTQGAPQQALERSAAELAGARTYRAPKIEARALMLRGSALLALDQRSEADVAFREALGISERLHYQHGVWQAHGLLAQVATRNGNTDRASEHRGRAQRAAETAAQSLSDDELRGRLLASVSAL
jgi:tetratricopeptide (TPR) repeat protein